MSRYIPTPPNWIAHLLHTRSESSLPRCRSSLALFGIVAFSINLPNSAVAELWKCVPKTGDTHPIYTETPSFGEDVDCVQLSSPRYSKPGQGGAAAKKRKKDNDDGGSVPRNVGKKMKTKKKAKKN